MQPREFDASLKDLETRIDRLRALYEQYFRGYEKMEPLIPRKDFERRLYALRKEQPRNTALRFRFQQLLQRYTMFTTRWGRLTRQIEEGTHPMVLERLKRRRQRESQHVERSAETEAPAAYDLSLDQDLSLEELLSEAELDEVAAAVDRPGPHRATQPPPALHAAGRGLGGGSRRPVPPVPPPSLDDDEEDTRSTGVHKPVKAEPARRPATGAAPPKAPVAPVSTARKQFAAPTDPGQRRGRPTPPDNQNTARPQPAPAQPQRSVQRSFARPAAAAPVQASGPRRAPAPPASNGTSNGVRTGLEESRVRAIYEQFVAARRANNEPDNVRYETVAKRIETMLPELRKRHGGRAIDFDVVVSNGRVGLRPRRG